MAQPLADAQEFRAMPAVCEVQGGLLTSCVSRRQKNVQFFKALLAKSIQSILSEVPHRLSCAASQGCSARTSLQPRSEDLCRVAHECLTDCLRTSVCPYLDFPICTCWWPARCFARSGLPRHARDRSQALVRALRARAITIR